MRSGLWLRYDLYLFVCACSCVLVCMCVYACVGACVCACVLVYGDPDWDDGEHDDVEEIQFMYEERVVATV
jgi:hypothetical protein